MTRYSVVTPRKKVYQVCISETDTARARCPEPSSDFLPPSPPGEKAAARQDQAGQTRAGDGAGNGYGYRAKQPVHLAVDPIGEEESVGEPVVPSNPQAEEPKATFRIAPNVNRDRAQERPG